MNPDRLEAGCDEVGRGCLAGPVVAAAVILPADFLHPHLNDSKQMSEKRRKELEAIIKADAIAWHVTFIDPEKVDEINVLNASFLGMEESVKKLNRQPEHLLIDGNKFRTTLNIPFDCVIKGDGKYGSIAAASILAKTARDDYMRELHKEYPHYGWDRNVGYPTAQHRAGIKEHGPTPYHRKSFKLLPDQLTLDF